MSRKFTLAALVAAGILVLGCTGTDRSPTGTRLAGPHLELVSPSLAQIEDQINALFPSGGLRTAATTHLTNITKDLSDGKTDNARKKTFALVNFLRQKQSGGQLLDPNGAAAPTTGEASDALVASLFLYVGLTPSGAPPGIIDVDAAIAVIGPSGGTVMTGGDFPNAAVVFPAGALGQFVTVTIDRLPDPAPGLYGQIPYPKYAIPFDVKIVPNVPLAIAATVAVCTVEPPNPGSAPSTAKLALAHITGPTTFELLPQGTSPGPLPSLCDEALLASNDPRPDNGLRLALWQARRAGDRLLDALSPQSAYAGHGGLLGQTTSFSPFVPADTVNPLTTGSWQESGTDASCSPNTAVLRCPDFVSSSANVDATSLHIGFQFATGRYKSDSVLVYVTLDMDQDPATGFRGLTSGAGTDDALIGGDYFISYGPNAASGFATVTHAVCPTPNQVPTGTNPQGGCTFTTVGTAPAVATADGVDITVPRNLIQDFDGKLNYKATSQKLLTPTTFGGIEDFISNVGQQVISVGTGTIIL